MKKTILTIFMIIISIISTKLALASINDSDKEQVHNSLGILVDAVNKSNTEKIKTLLSPDVSEALKQEIQNNIRWKNIKYEQNIDNFEEISSDRMKITGTFAARGTNWNISGSSNYFIFKKIDQKWYLSESDFAKKLSSEYVFKFVWKIIGIAFIIVIPIFLVLFIFWVRMIIDVSKRPLEDKTVWILIIIFLNWFGALLYFFIARKKHIKSLQKEKKHE